MDFISEVFSLVRLKTTVYFKHSFCDAWGMSIPKIDYAQFHLICSGSAVLQVEGEKESIRLFQGDIVIFPYGNAHKIMDSKDSVCLPGTDVVNNIMDAPFQKDQVAARTVLICGHYELDKEFAHPILEQLPAVLIIKSGEYGRADLIYATLESIIEEMTYKKPGYHLVSTRLAEVLFISVIRYYFMHKDYNKPILKDEIILNALNLMHTDLSKNWKIQELAHQVGVSRTLFIDRFKMALSTTPIKYISQWKMTKAKLMLKQTDRSIAEISELIGYESDAAFIRAFRQMFTLSPGKYRRSTQY